MSQQFQTPIPTLPSPIQTLLHPAPTLIADSLPDYLTNSMIHTLRESCIFAMNRRRELELELERAGLTGVGKGKGKDLAEGEKERELEEALKERLGRIGRIVGAQLAELISVHRPPLPNHLEIVKFICKEFFLHVYARQIDNLRTNHRGTFVLQSNALPPLIPLSTTLGPAADLELTRLYLIYPAALVQGALGKLGMDAVVTAESSGLPQCTFQIKTKKDQPGGTAYATLSAQ